MHDLSQYLSDKHLTRFFNTKLSVTELLGDVCCFFLQSTLTQFHLSQWVGFDSREDQPRMGDDFICRHNLP